MDKETNVYKLEVLDNGKGLPQEFDIKFSQSFGLQMVNELVAQLNGTLKLETENGTKFTIYISEKEGIYDNKVA